MREIPQQYLDATLGDATFQSYDTVQLKYRGLWTRIEILQGRITFHDPAGNYLSQIDTPAQDLCCTLIGDYFGPPRTEKIKVIVWDCWRTGVINEDHHHVHWDDLTTYPYRDRLAFARLHTSRVGAPLEGCKTYPIASAQTLWNSQTPNTCGLVFRKSTDPVDHPLLVVRAYDNLPRGLE